MKDVNIKEMFAGLFLAKFDRVGLTKLGFESFTQAFKELALLVGGKANSINNYRDEFDPVFPNERRGWCNRQMHKTRTEMFAKYGALNIDDMYDMLLEMFVGVEAYLNSINDIFKKGNTWTDVSDAIKQVELNNLESTMHSDFNCASVVGKERLATIKARVNQSQYRKWIIKIYRGECCITGLNIPEILRASHIIGLKEDFENRMNPENGLCLSATYDAAFDRHLISFDDDYRMILAPSLRDYYTNKAFQDLFKHFEGARITLPIRFLPSKSLLAKHRDLLR